MCCDCPMWCCDFCYLHPMAAWVSIIFSIAVFYEMGLGIFEIIWSTQIVDSQLSAYLLSAGVLNTITSIMLILPSLVFYFQACGVTCCHGMDSIDCTNRLQYEVKEQSIVLFVIIYIMIPLSQILAQAAACTLQALICTNDGYMYFITFCVMNGIFGLLWLLILIMFIYDAVAEVNEYTEEQKHERIFFTRKTKEKFLQRHQGTEIDGNKNLQEPQSTRYQ